jgi:hypothetical protein
VLKNLAELFKNRVFLISLLIVNAIIFIFGFIINDFELMFLSLFSYAAVMLSLQINKDPNDNEEDE